MVSGDRSITYSPAFTLVPTYECFNRCSYCNFRRESGEDQWLSLDVAAQRLSRFSVLGGAARERLKSVSAHSLIEVLILCGEVHPLSPRRADWFVLIYELCELVLEYGFLPHTNAGPLSKDEMASLAEVNVSMGLMLEQLTPALLDTVHRHAPSKEPELRLQQLVWAGELGIPFTTGLLLGIGETVAERRQTLEEIAVVHRQWGHIQEVILQPHSPGQRQLFPGEACDAKAFLATVELAREILPDSIALQIPPNLAQDVTLLRDCLAAGVTDLGGLVPLDEVNPDYEHLSLEQLASLLAGWGYGLTPRLPVYPQYIDGLSPRLRDRCRAIQAEL